MHEQTLERFAATRPVSSEFLAAAEDMADHGAMFDFTLDEGYS